MLLDLSQRGGPGSVVIAVAAFACVVEKRTKGGALKSDTRRTTWVLRMWESTLRRVSHAWQVRPGTPAQPRYQVATVHGCCSGGSGCKMK